jgi:PAS domain S-box-containing protein
MDKLKSSILVVDDSNTSSMALTNILSHEYTVYTAYSGQEAVMAAIKYLPDVILLDIVMPDIDGYEVISELKKIPGTKDIPIIFITGLTHAGNEEKGLALGAADYISKPFSPAIVKLRVRNQIKMLEQLRLIEYNVMKYKLISDALGISLWDMEIVSQDPDSPENKLSWSPELRRMLGFTDENDFPNTMQALRDRLHPEDRDKAHTAFVAHFQDRTGRTPYNMEYRLLLKNGEYRYFQALGAALRDSAGAPIRITGAIMDITDRIQTQEMLKKRGKMLGTLNEMAIAFLSQSDKAFDDIMTEEIGQIAGMVSIDRLSVWRNIETPGSLRRSRIYRWEKSVGGSTRPQDVTTGADMPYDDVLSEWKERLSRGDCINGPVRGMSQGVQAGLASQGVLSVLVVPVFIRNSFWGAVCFDDCHSERVFSAEEESILRSSSLLFTNAFLFNEMVVNIRCATVQLETALEQAAAASKAKSDFLAHMSHEMRSPLNAIIGMMAIGKKAENIKQKDYALSRIEEAASHLLGVINDVLDMAKIEENKLELDSVEYHFERMLQNVVGVVNFRVDEKRQTLTISVDKNIPRFIVGDEQRLAQVITNLMSNAMKFTPKGGLIHLEAAMLDEVDGNCELRVEVTDSGIGISPEQQKKIFLPFEQAESGTSRKYGGTGLGLVISRRIVELMGGRIWVESELGKGAKFSFTVHVLRGKKNHRSLLAPGVSWDNVRILAVDDMPEIRVQFQDLFGQLNINCDVAADGSEACRRIEECGGYDIYFIDWVMPGMDGIELTRHIKLREGARPSVVIMITANDWEMIREQALKAGVDKCLLKPLLSSMIIDCVNECLGTARESGKDLGNTDGEFTGKRMLLVEDIEINREILIALLENTGLIIDCAENGKEALDMVEAHPGKYDVVFMDIQMPIMAGHEATRRIRALPAMQGAGLPIIAMTANVFKEDIEACLEAGMDDHLGKPLDMENVFEKLRKYIGSSQ